MHVSWIIIRLLSIACAAFPLHTFSATVFKFSDTPPRITAHQPGLPGIRYSFPSILVIRAPVDSTNTASPETTTLFFTIRAHYTFVVVISASTGEYFVKKHIIFLIAQISITFRASYYVSSFNNHGHPSPFSSAFSGGKPLILLFFQQNLCHQKS